MWEVSLIAVYMSHCYNNSACTIYRVYLLTFWACALTPCALEHLVTGMDNNYQLVQCWLFCNQATFKCNKCLAFTDWVTSTYSLILSLPLGDLCVCVMYTYTSLFAFDGYLFCNLQLQGGQEEPFKRRTMSQPDRLNGGLCLCSLACTQSGCLPTCGWNSVPRLRFPCSNFSPHHLNVFYPNWI